MLALVKRYPGLSIVPATGSDVRAQGWLDFRAIYNSVAIEDAYQVVIFVPPEFPREYPRVVEVGGRIPRSFHTHADNTLCLGSPTRLRLCLRRDPTLTGFVENCLVPYLYGFSFRQRHSHMPFGELAHGTKGLLQDLAALFNAKNGHEAFQLARMASRKRIDANRLPCPCNSQRSVANCHGPLIDNLRDALGKDWFAEVCIDVWESAEAESKLQITVIPLETPLSWDWRAFLPGADRVFGGGRRLQPRFSKFRI